MDRVHDLFEQSQPQQRVLEMATEFITWADLDHFLAWIRGRVNFSETELTGFFGWSEVVEAHSMGGNGILWIPALVKHFERVQLLLDCHFNKLPRSPDEAAVDIPFPRPLPGHYGYSRVRHICLYTRECGNDMCPRKTFTGAQCIPICLTY